MPWRLSTELILITVVETKKTKNHFPAGSYLTIVESHPLDPCWF